MFQGEQAPWNTDECCTILDIQPESLEVDLAQGPLHTLFHTLSTQTVKIPTRPLAAVDAGPGTDRPQLPNIADSTHISLRPRTQLAPLYVQRRPDGTSLGSKAPCPPPHGSGEAQAVSAKQGPPVESALQDSDDYNLPLGPSDWALSFKGKQAVNNPKSWTIDPL